MIGRLRMRSAQTPAANPNITPGATPTAPRMPICRGDAPSVTTAAKLNAPSHEPNCDTVLPAQRFTKSPFRHSPVSLGNIRIVLT